MSVQAIIQTGIGGDLFASPITISVAASASNASITIPPGMWLVSCASTVSMTINNSGTYLPFIPAGTGDMLISDGSPVYAASNSASSAANITLIRIKGSI
jgi:hypothetical protein